MKTLLISLFTLLVVGCAANVPKEVVELSYKMEKDLMELESTYVLLVKQHFTLLRSQREGYLKNEWAPRYIKSWVTDGQLIEMSNGSVFYDEESDEFIPITTPKPAEQLRGVFLWADAAVADIDDKRAKLLNPLIDAEQKLLADIQKGFSLIRLSNQTISAHLNSIREVQDVQNNILEQHGWSELRDNINTKLGELSDQAQSGLEDIRKLDKKIN
jgi:hypothetical protein